MEMRHLKLEPYLSKPTKQQLAIDDFDILKCIGVG
jgi:serum/glucocorticoid-regulated kinase 2